MCDHNVTSIVIVNWNSGPYLESCVRSLVKNARTSEIIIVDNASSDSSLYFAREFRARLKVLINDRNLGYAAANNIGWRASHGARVLFLNPDTECFAGALEHLEQTLDSDESIWAVGGKLVDPAGTPQMGFNIRVFPSIGGIAAEMLFVDEIWPSNPWTGPNRQSGSWPAVDVDQPAGACLMVSRHALEAVGGFDEAFYPAWFEDVDFCRRIRRQGGRIRYQPEACFLHFGGHSLGQMSRQDFLKSYHRNQIRYFRKHHGARTANRVKRLIALGLFLRSILSIAYPLVPNQSRMASARIYWKTARFISDVCEASR
jgi:N-acetylglucosaminyl-diphospho-decaprenol L-rhamnosyltransferase